MATQSIQELRELAMRRHRAAGSKVSRLRKQGVDPLSVDPRRNAANVKRYNRKQLESYISKLDSFNDRSNQFVRGRRGEPIPKATFERYQRAERAHNIKVSKYVAEFGDYKIPTQGGTTVAQRLRNRGQRVEGMQRMGDGFGLKPTDAIERSSGTFGSARAMNAYTRELLRRVKPNYHLRKVNNHRRGVIDMLETIGEQKMANRVKGLSQKQFDLLWNFTPFSDSTALNYENIKSGNLRSVDLEIAKESLTEAKELLAWAEGRA